MGSASIEDPCIHEPGLGLFTAYSLAGSPWTVHLGGQVGAMSWDQAALLLDLRPLLQEDISGSGSAAYAEAKWSAS